MLRTYRKSERVMDHPKTRTLYDYWNELRAGRDAPSRSEVDPRRIADTLESMFIFEALAHGQLRFRLAGTALCEMLGMEARGMLAEGVMTDAHAHDITDLAHRTLSGPGVGVMRVRGEDAAGESWTGEILLLPLRSELGDLDRVLGCVAIVGVSRRRRPAAPMRLRCLGSRLLPIETGPGSRRFDPLGAKAGPPPAAGFAEPSANWQGPRRRRTDPPAETPSEPEGPRLTKIEGNPDAPRDPENGKRPKLRIVRD
ncbi:MAG TPA: PAS domain-containing protein [Paracoccaceae bacterium]|nr:PAS domain-containing protein [Paracoccaceae bacterium]